MARDMVLHTPPALASNADHFSERGRWRHAKLRLNWHLTLHQLQAEPTGCTECSHLMNAEANAWATYQHAGAA